jgi:hypothetical protein
MELDEDDGGGDLADGDDDDDDDDDGDGGDDDDHADNNEVVTHVKDNKTRNQEHRSPFEGSASSPTVTAVPEHPTE